MDICGKFRELWFISLVLLIYLSELLMVAIDLLSFGSLYCLSKSLRGSYLRCRSDYLVNMELLI